jgi:urocanate hydratase
VTSGLGGMSGAQAKATTIGGGICLVTEINEKPLNKRHQQGYLDEKYSDLDQVIKRVKEAKAKKEAVSIGYLGNAVDLWEKIADSDLVVEIGSDQSSLHNPYFGGYYPAGLSYDESNRMMTDNPQLFKQKVDDSLRR